jgi:hypothetical protein
VGTGTKEVESSTWRDWAAGFRHITSRFSLGARFEKYELHISLIIQFFSGLR